MKREVAGLLQALVVLLLNVTNFAAPLLRWVGTPSSLTLAKWIYQGWSLNCHQLPGRSFFILGYQLAMCARCTGIWLGSLLYCLWMLVTGRIGTDKPMRILWFVLLLAPLVIDGGTQALGWRYSDNLLRPITGLWFGWACSALALPWVNRFASDPATAFNDLKASLVAPFYHPTQLPPTKIKRSRSRTSRR